MMRVLIVDDELSIRSLLREWVEMEESSVMEATSASDAMAVISAHGVPAIVVCDIHLPGRDGIWLAERLRSECPQAAVITTTTSADLKPALRSMHAGAVDHLVYPFTQERLSGALTRARLAHLYRRVMAEMQKEVDLRRQELTAALQELELASKKTLEAMLVLRRPHDPEVLGKANRIAGLAVNLAMMLRIAGPQLSAIECAVFLQASTTLPTPAELRSLEALRNVPMFASAIDIALAAHERYDGSGFPIGLREDEIPLSARIIAVAAAYDELAAGIPRDLRAGTTVVDILCREGASRFDPAVLEALRHMHPSNGMLPESERALQREVAVWAPEEALVKEDPRRLWMRKQLAAAVPAEIGGKPARVIEVSYGGCRVETPEPLSPTSVGPFALNIPGYRVRADGTWKWTSPLGSSGRYCYGAAVSDKDARSGSRWRALVDALPKQPAPISEWQ